MVSSKLCPNCDVLYNGHQETLDSGHIYVKGPLKIAEEPSAECRRYYENFDLKLEEPFNTQVVSHLTRVPEDTGLKINFAKLDTQKFKLYQEDLETLQSHDIRSLVVDTFQFWEQFELEDKKSLDIVGILKACLNENSCRNLKHLQIVGSAVFPVDWVKKVAEMLPNLQFFECEVKTEKDFKEICQFFSNLVHLKVVGDPLKNIDGIGKLKSLQAFDASFLKLDSPEQLEELFEIPNLRVLDISFSQNVIRNLLLCDETLPNLRYLECYGSDITEEQLKMIVQKYSSLQGIGIVGNPCDFINLSSLRINIQHLATFNSTMNILRQTSNLCSQKLNERILNECMDRMEDLLQQETLDGFEEEVFLDLMMKVAVKLEFYYKDTERLVRSLILYFKRVYFPDQKIIDIPELLGSIADCKTLVERRWAVETVLRYFPGK